MSTDLFPPKTENESASRPFYSRSGSPEFAPAFPDKMEPKDGALEDVHLATRLLNTLPSVKKHRTERNTPEQNPGKEPPPLHPELNAAAQHAEASFSGASDFLSSFSPDHGNSRDNNSGRSSGYSNNPGGAGGAPPPGSGGNNEPAEFPDESPHEPLEVRLATTWLPRIGGFLLLVGVGLGAALTVPQVSLGGRFGFGYITSLALLVIGYKMQGRSTRVGRSTMAIGASLGYFASFATHFIEQTQVIPMMAPALLLMLGFVGMLIWMADTWRSQSTCMLAILLGMIASLCSSQASGFSALIPLLGMTTIGTWFMTRHGWTALTAQTIILTYGSFAALWWLAPQTVDSTTAMVHLTALFGSNVILSIGFDMLMRRRGDSEALLKALPVWEGLNSVAFIAAAFGLFFWSGLINEHLDTAAWSLAAVEILRAARIRKHAARETTIFHLIAANLLIVVGCVALFEGEMLILSLALVALMTRLVHMLRPSEGYLQWVGLVPVSMACYYALPLWFNYIAGDAPSLYQGMGTSLTHALGGLLLAAYTYPWERILRPVLQTNELSSDQPSGSGGLVFSPFDLHFIKTGLVILGFGLTIEALRVMIAPVPQLAPNLTLYLIAALALRIAASILRVGEWHSAAVPFLIVGFWQALYLDSNIFFVLIPTGIFMGLVAATLNSGSATEQGEHPDVQKWLRGVDALSYIAMAGASLFCTVRWLVGSNWHATFGDLQFIVAGGSAYVMVAAGFLLTGLAWSTYRVSCWWHSRFGSALLEADGADMASPIPQPLRHIRLILQAFIGVAILFAWNEAPHGWPPSGLVIGGVLLSLWIALSVTKTAIVRCFLTAFPDHRLEDFLLISSGLFMVGTLHLRYDTIAFGPVALALFGLLAGFVALFTRRFLDRETATWAVCGGAIWGALALFWGELGPLTQVQENAIPAIILGAACFLFTSCFDKFVGQHEQDNEAGEESIFAALLGLNNSPVFWPITFAFGGIAYMLIGLNMLSEMPSGYITTLWGATGLGALILGAIFSISAWRWSGLAVFLLALGRILFVDLLGAGSVARVVAFIALGLILVAAGLIYGYLHGRLGEKAQSLTE